MKRVLISLSLLICTTVFAHTTDWYVDNVVYQTTTCSAGDNVTPPTPPTKKGYTFWGWSKENTINGTWEQAGTPKSSAPIYPVFYQDGNLILRSLGVGSNRIADTYDAETGKITRRVGVITIKGNESWIVADNMYIKPDAGDAFANYSNLKWNCNGCQNQISLSSHFKVSNNAIWATNGQSDRFTWNGIQLHLNIANSALGITDYTQETRNTLLAKIKAYLAAQYAAGTPVTIYYPLITPTEEIYAP